MKEASKIGKVAHNLGMSAWFGGTLFGQVSLNPTVSSISDRSERGRVLNEAWARFQAVNMPAALSTLLGWRLGGVREDAELRAPGLTHAKDLLLGGAAFKRPPLMHRGRYPTSALSILSPFLECEGTPHFSGLLPSLDTE